MATYLTSHPARRAANHLFALRNHQHSSLSVSVLTGLEMFGLAMNGMCLAALAHSLSEIPKSGLRGRAVT
jgi:hypothetical protein